MENTTIAVTNEIRDKIKEFGNKGETYSEIIEKLIESAKKRQLQDLLMDNKNTISVKQARAEANKKWPKSK